MDQTLISVIAGAALLAAYPIYHFSRKRRKPLPVSKEYKSHVYVDAPNAARPLEGPSGMRGDIGERGFPGPRGNSWDNRVQGPWPRGIEGAPGSRFDEDYELRRRRAENSGISSDPGFFGRHDNPNTRNDDDNTASLRNDDDHTPRHTDYGGGSFGGGGAGDSYEDNNRNDTSYDNSTPDYPTNND